jgi:hypothetical protein
MAVWFNGTATLDLGSALVTAVPNTFAAVFRAGTIGAAQSLVAAANSATSGNYFSMEIAAGGTLRCRSNDNVGSADSSSALTMIPGGIYLGVASFVSPVTSRRNYHNDFAVSSSGLTNRTPASINRFSLGRKASSATPQNFTGAMAWAAVWNVALEAHEARALWEGEHPTRVRPQGLIAYWPLTDTGSIQYDRVGASHLTVTSGPMQQVDFPRWYREPRNRIIILSGSITADPNTSTLTTGAIAVASLAVSAATTNKNFSALQTKAVAVASLAISAATTEKHKSAITAKAVSVDAFAVSATVLTAHRSSIPVAAVAVAALAPTATTTDAHKSLITKATVAVQSYPIGAVTTGASVDPFADDGAWLEVYRDYIKRRQKREEDEEVSTPPEVTAAEEVVEQINEETPLETQPVFSLIQPNFAKFIDVSSRLEHLMQSLDALIRQQREAEMIELAAELQAEQERQAAIYRAEQEELERQRIALARAILAWELERQEEEEILTIILSQ